MESFGDVRSALQTLFHDPVRACLTWLSKTDLSLSEEGVKLLPN